MYIEISRFAQCDNIVRQRPVRQVVDPPHHEYSTALPIGSIGFGRRDQLETELDTYLQYLAGIPLERRWVSAQVLVCLLRAYPTDCQEALMQVCTEIVASGE